MAGTFFEDCLRTLRWWRSAGPRVHFIHFGKSGGTTVMARLRQASLRDRLRRCCRIQLHRDHDFTLRDVPEGDLCFFFIREPIARYVSGFNSRLREGMPTFRFPHSDAERRLFGLFPTPSALAEALSSDDRELREQADQAFGEIRHLRRDYAHYLGGIENLEKQIDSVFFIGRQETFDSSWHALNDILHPGVREPEEPQVLHETPVEYSTTLSPLAVENLQVRLKVDIAIHEHLTTSERWRSKFAPA